MKRMIKSKVKREQPETSASYTKDLQEHDLAYYIHDRVELMHQVFTLLKSKDLKAMAPECVRNISIDDLQELCTEELLGISSKRLCATLDGAEPPSDTESSSQSESPELMETISLDSISSDEEILSQASSKKKKHKHRRRDSKTKSKHKSKKSKEAPPEDQDPEKSKASRAGLTVLELLELQARARAIRAQLQQDHTSRRPSDTAAPQAASGHSDNEVEIKEEPAEVVEISSDDEKPNIHELEKANTQSANKESERNGIDPRSKEPDKDTESTSKETEKKKKDASKKKAKKDSNKSKRSSQNKKDAPTKETIIHTNESSTSEDANRKSGDSAVNKDIELTEGPQTVTKRINDLIITVPQQHSRKIKLNRTKMSVSISNIPIDDGQNSRIVSSVVLKPTENVSEITAPEKVAQPKEKFKKKQKKKKKLKSVDKEGSDYDEITLQLSDTEKMDLLEDFDRKNYDSVSSSDSEDSESSSDTESESTQESKDNSVNTANIRKKGSGDINIEKVEQPEEVKNLAIEITNETVNPTSKKALEKALAETEALAKLNDEKSKENDNVTLQTQDKNTKNSEASEEKQSQITDIRSQDEVIQSIDKSKESSSQIIVDTELKGSISVQNQKSTEEVIEITNMYDITVQNETDSKSQDKTNQSEISETEETLKVANEHDNIGDDIDKDKMQCAVSKEATIESCANAKENEKGLSDGELSEHESSEVEAVDLKPEVVCISDEDDKNKSSKKKKKKEKKSKREKKSKKSKSNFQENVDQNFYIENSVQNTELEIIGTADFKTTDKVKFDPIPLDEDDIYEILELSDDSSCYEVEGTVLSKEPTAKEIAALSAKIDEIEREDVITDEQIREHERLTSETKHIEQNEENAENISWKDRYLSSKKVKRVLTTSNILNALRKKNKELKIKLEESKQKETEIEVEKEKEPTQSVSSELEDGSIEQFNTLQGSTKYVDPIPDPTVKKIDDSENKEVASTEIKNPVENMAVQLMSELTENIGIQVTGEMKKDAKQLLKMYKKLLKYNDMTKQKDPSKKKKKKKKKENASDASAVDKDIL